MEQVRTISAPQNLVGAHWGGQKKRSKDILIASSQHLHLHAEVTHWASVLKRSFTTLNIFLETSVHANVSRELCNIVSYISLTSLNICLEFT